jgi:hypothetical protein
MYHCNNAGAVLLLNSPDGMSALHGIPSSHDKRLQGHEGKENKKDG